MQSAFGIKMLAMSQIAKAYTLLSSLKQNLPDNRHDVAKVWVDDYHSILNLVEKETGESLREFRVPDGELYRPMTSHNRMTVQSTYTRDLRQQEGCCSCLAQEAEVKASMLRLLSDGVVEFAATFLGDRRALIATTVTVLPFAIRLSMWSILGRPILSSQPTLC